MFHRIKDVIKTISFTDETKEAIIAEQKALGFRLYEEQLHTDGNWLLFTDEPYIETEPPRDLAAEIDALKARVGKLEKK
jgi:hypothetical protein